ncbi:MAG: glycosyltransferase family 2 protein [Candidatus Microsaccharimonas sp.]
MPSTLIVVLNWNGSDDTIDCIESLSCQTFKDFQVLVVDNGSKQADYEQLLPLKKQKFVTLIRNEKNLGFAGGVNTGISYAINNNYKFVALFNNDAVADKDWLKNLHKGFEVNDSISAVTGLLLHQDGKTIDSTGDYYSIWGMPFPRSRNDKTATAPDSGYVFSATGGATLYKTNLFKQIGLFDASFFAYYEDVDVSFRTQLTGHTIYYTNTALAYHKQGATSGKIPGFTVYQTFKNIPLLYIKDVPTSLLIPIGLRLFVLYCLIFGNAIKNGVGKYALKGWLASIWYFWTKALWDRFSIQAHKTVPTKYIKSLIYPDLPPDQTGMRKLRQRLINK